MVDPDRSFAGDLHAGDRARAAGGGDRPPGAGRGRGGGVVRGRIGSDGALGVLATLTGLGVITIALAPFALPILILTLASLLPFVVPIVVLGIPVGLIVGVVVAVRAIAGRGRRRRGQGSPSGSA